MPRKRKDSTAERTLIMAHAIKGIGLPEHLKLRDQDVPFWKAIIEARAEWTVVDLAPAANLARCQADIERIQNEILVEGDTIKNDRGTMVMNPKHSLLETLSRRSVALSRVLQVHAAATIGESKLSRGKNEEKAKAVNAVKKVNKKHLDDLIPGINSTAH